MQHQRLVNFLNEQKLLSGMSLAEISRRAGLNDSQMSNVMNGVVPGLKVCQQLAEYFELSLSYVLYLAGHIENPPGGNSLELDRIAHMLDNIGDSQTRDRAIDAATAVLQAFMREDRERRKLTRKLEKQASNNS